MLEQISYYQILGKPLNFYLGLLALVGFTFAATIAFLNKKGIRKIPFKWHSKVAFVSLTFGIVHGILAILTYF